MQIPASIAGTPLGRRLAWWIDHVRSGMPPLSENEMGLQFAIDRIRREFIVDRLERARAALPQATFRDVRAVSDAIGMMTFERDGRVSDLCIRIEPEPPHRALGFVFAERVPGFAIRDATEADAAALRALELAVPIVMGDETVVYDRGDDYFAAERLMGDAVTHIVELDGRPVGLAAWVAHRIRVGGRTLDAGFKHRQRLLPEARGTGVRQMQDLAGTTSGYAGRDILYTYAAVANATVRKAYGEPQCQEHPPRIVIDTKAHAGPDPGRPATAADSARIVALLNGTHEREEMYVPYTEASLAERLSREPSLYSWPQMRLGERAVLGVWNAHLNVIHTAGGETTTNDRALVLDYGYEPGAEAELLDLLRAECAALARDGATELSIFVASQSGLHQHVASMAKRIDEYLLYLPMPPPDDVAERGLYVDQLYF